MKRKLGSISALIKKMKHQSVPLDVAKWLRFFEKNRYHRPEPRCHDPISLPAAAAASVIQSLREFQLGDGGGPAFLIAWNRDQWLDHQPGLRDVVKAWFKEEEGHSYLLGLLLKRFQATPLRGHWSFSLFCTLRRVLGVSFELQILTLTELSSTAYYRCLKASCPDIAVKDVCALILRDEAGHIAFQADRLRAQGAPWQGVRRWIWTAQFYAAGIVAASVLWSSHHRCLRKLGVTTGEFLTEAHRQFARFLVKLRRPAIVVKKTPALVTALAR
jgi:hypothetical protein